MYRWGVCSLNFSKNSMSKLEKGIQFLRNIFDCISPTAPHNASHVGVCIKMITCVMLRWLYIYNSKTDTL